MIATEQIVTEKFTSADLALMPDDGKRREIIEGELYVYCNTASWRFN